MRVIFNEELKQVADDLDRMAQNVRKAIKGAGEALLNQDVEAAQTVIDGDIEIDALESSVIDQCVKLLAKQNPVATDLSGFHVRAYGRSCPPRGRGRSPHLSGRRDS